jgi:hypothetical protein
VASYGFIAKLVLDSARIAARAQQQREREAARAARAKAAAEQRQATTRTAPPPRNRNLADAPGWTAPAEYRGVPVRERSVRPPINDPQTLAAFRGQAPATARALPDAPPAPAPRSSQRTFSALTPPLLPRAPAPSPRAEPTGRLESGTVARDKLPRPLLLAAGRLVTATRRADPELLQEGLHVSEDTAHHILLTLQTAGVVSSKQFGVRTVLISSAVFELTLADTKSGTVDAVERRRLELQLVAEAAQVVADGKHSFPELLEQRLGVTHETAVNLLSILEHCSIVGPEMPGADREVLVSSEAIEAAVAKIETSALPHT